MMDEQTKSNCFIPFPPKIIHLSNSCMTKEFMSQEKKLLVKQDFVIGNGIIHRIGFSWVPTF